MRKSLFTAAALAPLMLLAAQSAAQAQVSISDDRTAPIQTSTANNGQPADVTITGTGSVTVTTGTAVTVDSDNDFTNQGAITVNDADNGVGVLIETPHTGDFTNSGDIEVVEDFTPTDTNEDGIIDGPFAEGTGRYGVRITGPGMFTGNWTSSGSITVEGNNSFGVSIESDLIGDVLNSGAIHVTGNDSYGFRSTGTIDGDVRFSGQVNVVGGGSRAVELSDVTGALSIYNVIQATGYRTTQRPTTQELRDKLLPENIQNAGPALTIAGDVAGGIFIGAPPPVNEDTEDDEDNDHDGVPDLQEGTGLIQMFGEAPALVIGADGRNVHVGVFGADENAYGLIVRGAVDASGVFDGKNATGVQIGTGAGTVDIDGGIRVVGQIRATAIDGQSTAIRILSGAQTDKLLIEGTLNSATISDKEAGDAASRAVLIEQGASLTSLENNGTLRARNVSDAGSAYAIVDLSGTLSNITNTDQILATVEARQTAEGQVGETTGQSVAMDLRANTTGVTIDQHARQLTETTTTTPAIRGDVLLGAGGDSVSLAAGSMIGALDFAGGANDLLIDNGATYFGALTGSGTVDIDVRNGRLDNRSATTIASNGFHVGQNGIMTFAVDPENDRATRIDVNGAATVDAGGHLGINILTLPQGEQTFTILDADTLNIGTPDSELLTATPFLFVATAETDQAAGTVDLTVRRRTAEEAGFNASETAAYDSIYASLPQDTGILSAMVAQTTQEGLIGVYDQLLPDHAGGVTRSLSWATEAAGKAAANWPRGEKSPGPTRGWTQEIGMGESKERAQASAYRIYGFGGVGGIESMSASGNTVGAYVGFTTANINNPDTEGDDEIGASMLSGAVYWRAAFGNIHADAQAGAGYVWADSRRELVYSDQTQIVHRLSEAEWNGYALFARAGLAYEARMGRFVATPGVHLDYFRLYQSGYTEAGGGPGFDLDIESKTSDVLAATGSLVVGYEFGGRTKFRPEVEVGWRQVVSGSAGTTEGGFVSGGIPFTLFGEPLEGGGPIARLGLRVYNDFIDLMIDAGGEFRDDYYDLDVRLSARMVF